ncbi:MAG: hypothetical protein AAFR31_14200 [Cyanobacteria bacterium J06627_8]
MNQPREHTKSEYESLLGIAEEYQGQGYAVSIAPPAQSLPIGLAGYPIDLIASRDDHTVAVSVRDKKGLTRGGQEDLREITKRVNQQPGWEFELVVTESEES